MESSNPSRFLRYAFIAKRVVSSADIEFSMHLYRIGGESNVEHGTLNTNNNKLYTTMKSTVDSDRMIHATKQQKLVLEIIFKSQLEKTRTEIWKWKREREKSREKGNCITSPLSPTIACWHVNCITSAGRKSQFLSSSPSPSHHHLIHINLHRCMAQKRMKNKRRVRHSKQELSSSLRTHRLAFMMKIDVN